ncbi:MAG: Eco29kI family restriction endonuclease [Victivallales bacterium]|nr:Eco29kI family restriction endonuclease [Victivallales bacterium]
MTYTPFNPLDKQNLAESIMDAMLQCPPMHLPPGQFIGAGIYAIYYTGTFPLYERIAELNANDAFRQPIYVGKAVPAGARRGGIDLGDNPGSPLYNRLRQHANSINDANNLLIDDFYCRYLTVDDIWIPLAESLLITRFAPLWNCTLDGFGNHAQGSGRDNQQKSPWDTLHPGRQWANNLQANNLSEEQLTQQLREFITTHYN